MKLQHHYSNMNAFKLVFLGKTWFKVVVRSVKLGKSYFLLNPYYLSITVANDNRGYDHVIWDELHCLLYSL